jgi:DNA polymerase III delta prime subunit
MVDTLEHLLPNARLAIDLPEQERILFLRQPRWIGYSQTREILGKLDRLLRHPRTDRMPNLLLVGETNNGKTTLVERFARMHPEKDGPEREGTSVPVLLIQAPPVPDETRFYNSILENLHAPYRSQASTGSKQIQVTHLLAKVDTRMLIVDEIHHLLAGSATRQRQFLNVLKYLGNELKIPIVGVGTVEAIRAIASDPQLANRFEPLVLRRWEMDQEFLMLLASFERLLPLRRHSELTESGLAVRLLAMCGGTIGELHHLLSAATECAILGGHEKIDLGLLRELAWIAPAERGRYAARRV